MKERERKDAVSTDLGYAQVLDCIKSCNKSSVSVDGGNFLTR